MANKAELLKFLDGRVFNPILRANPDGYSAAKSDLHSSTAKRVNSELEKLKLPTLPSVEHEFLQVAGEQYAE